MKAKSTKKAVTLFENIKKIDEEGGEYWSSRDLWKILEYTEHRHFLPVIEKAKISCENSGHLVLDHFEDILEMVPIGSNTERQMKSVKLSRYACYLTVQNADPGKTIVAQAQTYFAIQTRIAEVKQMEEYNRLTSEDEKRLFLRNEVTKHNLLLADAAKVAGVIKPKANQTHYDVGKKVRQTIEDLGGTMPEDLPTAESIKTIEAKQQKEIKE